MSTLSYQSLRIASRTRELAARERAKAPESAAAPEGATVRVLALVFALIAIVTFFLR
jgi:hypothetical protein